MYVPSQIPRVCTRPFCGYGFSKTFWNARLAFWYHNCQSPRLGPDQFENPQLKPPGRPLSIPSSFKFVQRSTGRELRRGVVGEPRSAGRPVGRAGYPWRKHVWPSGAGCGLRGVGSAGQVRASPSSAGCDAIHILESEQFLGQHNYKNYRTMFEGVRFLRFKGVRPSPAVMPFRGSSCSCGWWMHGAM